jgi:uracil-DNA glycosylase
LAKSLDCRVAAGQDLLVTATLSSLTADDLAGALDWWREAGVDHCFADAPRQWLASPVAAESPDLQTPAPLNAAPQRPTTAQRPVIGGEGPLPATLAEFREWWLIEPSLDSGQVQGRVPSRGGAGARVMVLVPDPEAEDREMLLSGPKGALLAAMLAAMGIAPDQACLASVLPRHTPHADWAALQQDGIARVLAQHIALAAPQRLIVFGSNILPLLGHDPAITAQSLHEFNHEGLSIPLLPAMELGVLLSGPRRKASFWQRWLDWTR